MVGFVMGYLSSQRPFDIKLLLLVVLCMVFARSAAMAFNRWLDRDIDAKNPRTIIREIPSGLIKANAALYFVIISSLFFIACTWFINPLCFALSPVALIIILGYSYTKRFTSLCHLVLGLGLALAPVGAFLAVTATFSVVPVLLGFSVLFWVAGFDVIYALQDEDFDKTQRLNSIPVALGRINSMKLSAAFHIVSSIAVILSIWLAHGVYEIGLISVAAVSVFLSMLVYQHLIIKPNDLSRVNLAFFTTNGVASLLFGSLCIIDLIT